MVDKNGRLLQELVEQKGAQLLPLLKPLLLLLFVLCSSYSSCSLLTLLTLLTILALALISGNDDCADCGLKAPEWASYNLGIFLCTRWQIEN